MACLQHNDIEELYTKDNFQHLNDNFEKFAEIVTDLYDYTFTYSGNSLKNDFSKYFHKLSRRSDITVKKTNLVYIYKMLIEHGRLENNPKFWTMIQKCPARNLSGVNSFAILLNPYPTYTSPTGKQKTQNFSCKHNCYYCPNETIANGSDSDMPRSYLKNEPAVARGFKNNWDCISQMNDRFTSLVVQGHQIDKIELIIEGGTYTEFPREYLINFHRDIFYSANVFFDKEKRGKYSLEKEMEENITSKVRVIGICIETRPDAIDDSWVKFLRESGVTRVQLGVQHTNDEILKKVNRGHTFKQAVNAISKLKNNCFKIDIHTMPDLPGSSPEKDKEMYDKLFDKSTDQADQMKIYPCEVTPYTIINKWYESGEYKPYGDDPQKISDVVSYAMEKCPPWIRFPRVVRDIPLSYINGGNKSSNLRQMVDDSLKKKGVRSMDIRSREIGRHVEYTSKTACLFIRKYFENDEAIDYFISFESVDNVALFGFIRLRILKQKAQKDVIFPELKSKGLIRELHVYNTLVPVGEKFSNSSQHSGFGKKLVQEAERLSLSHGQDGVAVISGEGVRGYYYKLGYEPTKHFLIKKFGKIERFINYGTWVNIINEYTFFVLNTLVIFIFYVCLIL